jgi:DMSO reductase anchor subunit
MEILKSRQQRIWRLPAVINFTLGSMGAGFYLLTLIESWLDGGPAGGRGTIEGVLAVALILTGFFALLFEAGNPLKSYLTILNVRHSWMSRELLFAILFIGLVGLDWLAPHSLIRALAGVAAFLFIVSQAFIVFKSRAVLSWNVWPIPPLLVLSGMSSGCGLLLLMRMREGISNGMTILVSGLLLLCLGVLLYYLFAFRKGEADFQAATRYLRSRLSLAVGVVVGLVGPLILLLVTWSIGAALANGLHVLAGMCIIVGALWRTRDIITRAGYFRRIELNL